MITRFSRIVSLGVSSLLALHVAGCCGKPECREPVALGAPSSPCGPETKELTALPPNAKPGECYAKVYVPPVYKTVTERVLVREASQRLEVVAAEYDWVEERVMVREASSELQVQPAEFASRDRTIEVAPARTEWEIRKAEDCDVPGDQPAKDVFCLTNRPPQQRTIQENYQVKPACVEKKVIPAEYQTIRRQRVVKPATTRTVDIPAEYADVEKQVKVCDARIAWQRVACDSPEASRYEPSPAIQSAPRSEAAASARVSGARSPDTINAVKDALRASGYNPGPNNGEIRARDWMAINKFQKDRSLPVGELDEQTLRALNIAVR